MVDLKETLRYNFFLGTFPGMFVSTDEVIDALAGHHKHMDEHDDIDILASSTTGEMLTLFSVGHKNQSIAWDHFDKLPYPNPLSQAKCRHCGALIKYSSGTTANVHSFRQM
ncbi:hypothetical protein JHK86_001636 [Glycine max]|nr:hypothetical protein JHK86_001636 [Glycine max]